MRTQELERYRILIAEPERGVAARLGYELAELGASILGPTDKTLDAIVLLVRRGRPDCAILNVALGGRPIFPLADILIECDVPIMFMATHDPMIVPTRFARIPMLFKPVAIADIALTLHATINAWHACA